MVIFEVSGGRHSKQVLQLLLGEEVPDRPWFSYLVLIPAHGPVFLAD